jgi:hypothetical protein
MYVVYICHVIQILICKVCDSDHSHVVAWELAKLADYFCCFNSVFTFFFSSLLAASGTLSGCALALYLACNVSNHVNLESEKQKMCIA